MSGDSAIAVLVPFGPVSVQITTAACSSVGTSGSNVVVITEADAEPDMLATIRVWREGIAPETVLLHWHAHSAAREVGVYFDNPSGTIFVGAGTVAAAVDVWSRTIKDQHTVCLFWAFQPIQAYVLELGELQAFLRASTGEIIASVPVDPPYEMHKSVEGIRFDSPVYGRQWLYFPR